MFGMVRWWDGGEGCRSFPLGNHWFSPQALLAEWKWKAVWMAAAHVEATVGGWNGVRFPEVVPEFPL